MPPRYWSVNLLVDAADAGPIGGAMLGLEEDVRWMRIGRRPLQDEDEPDTVTFELAARDAEHARRRGQQMLATLRALAGLPRGKSTVVWVARLDNQRASSVRFLEQAEELFDEERFAIAVVAAQVHLEVQVKLLAEMASEVASPVLRTVVASQGRWAPHDRWSRSLLEPLLGVQMTDFPDWEGYMAHVTRRNHAAHAGQDIDAESARSSIEVVRALWLWLNDAATAAVEAHADTYADTPHKSQQQPELPLV